jgi:hypothetical protein
METNLIEITKQYLATIKNPQSEVLLQKMFDISAKISKPRLAAGKAIVAYIKAEKSTRFSLAAEAEFETMVTAVNAA